MNNLCPLCRKSHELADCVEDFDTVLYKCSENQCKIHESIFVGASEVDKERRLNAIYNFLYEHPYADKHKTFWRFFYEETNDAPHKFYNINVFHLMSNYPYDIEKRTNAILLALNKLYPTMSDSFKIRDLLENKPRLFYPECLNMGHEKALKEFVSIYSVLSNLKYIELRVAHKDEPNENEYALTYDGLRKINELQSKTNNSKKIFIAMSFDKSVEYIEFAFKEAILNAGFQPMIIKDKEHNNYIMPEIFYEIENSSAVVMDLTSQNYGAYYEAGYALGLNKQVIACCKEDVFKDPATKPHFDIAQKSMIVWKDEQDLKEKLTKRIKYTVVVE